MQAWYLFYKLLEHNMAIGQVDHSSKN